MAFFLFFGKKLLGLFVWLVFKWGFVLLMDIEWQLEFSCQVIHFFQNGQRGEVRIPKHGQFGEKNIPVSFWDGIGIRTVLFLQPECGSVWEKGQHMRTQFLMSSQSKNSHEFDKNHRICTSFTYEGPGLLNWAVLIVMTKWTMEWMIIFPTKWPATGRNKVKVVRTNQLSSNFFYHSFLCIFSKSGGVWFCYFSKTTLIYAYYRPFVRDLGCLTGGNWELLGGSSQWVKCGKLDLRTNPRFWKASKGWGHQVICRMSSCFVSSCVLLQKKKGVYLEDHNHGHRKSPKDRVIPIPNGLFMDYTWGWS